MAADFFLHKKSEKENSVFFRLYGFTDKSITLGKFQKKDFFSRDIFKDYDIVRRMSGGRAVFHENDLTYCFNAPVSLFSDTSIKGTYSDISIPFIETFREYDVEPEVWKKASRDYASRDLCFSSVSLYEIKLDSKKLLGSAQYRSENTVSQHGTMYFDLPVIPGVMEEDICHCAFISDKDFRCMLKKNFEKHFDIVFEDYTFSDQDIEEISKMSSDFRIHYHQ